MPLHLKLVTHFANNQGMQQFFQWVEQRRHFVYLFQVADDAMQMDVHKTRYPFYTTKNAPCYSNSQKNALRCQQYPGILQ